MSSRRIALRLVPALVGLAAFGAMAALYRLQIVTYLNILYFVGLDPWHYPFLDSEFMYAMKNCWQRGIDVYQAVPCDVVPGNKMAYSPLWQRLPFLPTEPSARVPIGLATDLLWLLSLALLPPARAWWEAALLSLATLSSMVCFALERNNIDVWIYLLIVVGVLLFIRSGAARALGYAVFLAAGLLKYYPFVLFGLALKQRPRGFLLIAALATAALAIFVAWFWPELREELPNIPCRLAVRRLRGPGQPAARDRRPHGDGRSDGPAPSSPGGSRIAPVAARAADRARAPAGAPSGLRGRGRAAPPDRRDLAGGILSGDRAVATR